MRNESLYAKAEKYGGWHWYLPKEFTQYSSMF